MNYCDKCNEEVKKDDWRQHITSYLHTNHSGEKYCDICKKIIFLAHPLYFTNP